MQSLINNTKDKKEKSWLLNHYLEEFRGTIFRQVMFAEFEKITHAEIEKGGALTADSLCLIYRELNEKYFGSELVIDNELDMEWARIPHFYRNFYVYQYATGFSAAESISRKIMEEGEPAVKRYLNFLSAGRSDYPLNLLKKAGVDLSDSGTIQDAFDLFNKILSQMEELM
jgi:oligoendopeptidase F